MTAEGIPPIGGLRGPAAPNGRSVRPRITLEMVSHLSAVHQAHSSATRLLAESPLKAKLTEKLELAQMETGILERRLRSGEAPQGYRLEDLFDSVRSSLNFVRDELIKNVLSALGPEIPLPAPAPYGAGPEPEAEPGPIPSVPPPSLPPAPAPLPEPLPAPVPIEVKPSGVVPVPKVPLRESKEYLDWQQSLRTEQALGLGFVEGLEGGRLIERIFNTQELMIHKDAYGAALIDLVLDAVYKLRQRKIPGLHVLLARLPELDERGRARETVEVRGAAVEIIRLGYIAEEETSDPLTEAGRKFKKIEFYPMRRLAGESGVRYVPDNTKRLTEDAEADGYRGSSGTLIEIKYSSQPLTLNDCNGQVQRLLNQARKYQAAIRKGIIKFVTFIIIAPELDPELIKLIGGMVYGEIFHFTDITGRSGNLYPLLNPKVMPGKMREIRDSSSPEDKEKWEAEAWKWALMRYSGEPGKFKNSCDSPHNLHQDIRQEHAENIIDKLQKRLDEAISSAQQTKVHARNQAKQAEAEKRIADALRIKKNLSDWRRRLDKNFISTKAICEFSHVLAEVKGFLGN